MTNTFIVQYFLLFTLPENLKILNIYEYKVEKTPSLPLFPGL